MHVRILRKIFLSVAAIFLAFRSIELVKPLIVNNFKEFLLGESFFISVLINVFITGVFAFLGFAFKTYKFFPKDYYKIHSPKLLFNFSHFLHLQLFRKALLLFYWGKKNHKTRFFNGKKSGIANLIIQTKQAEIGHALSFYAILAVSSLLAIKGYSTIFYIANLINIVGNFYPILLQRTHRMRIEKISIHERI